MTKEIFADTVGRIDYTGGVIRAELVSMEPIEGKEDEARMEVRQRVVMPMDGFLHAFGTMGNLVQKLIESGVVVRETAEDGTEMVIPTADTPPVVDEAPSSPNFN